MKNKTTDNLQNLLKLVKELSSREDLSWFKKEMVDYFTNSENDYSNHNTEGFYEESKNILNNTEKIKKYLSISPELSIDYSFIAHKLLRTRLELDNLRMENVRIDLMEKNELKRLYDYIVYAFYQVENLINFYYHTKYRSIDSLLDHLESIQDDYYNFKRTGKESNVSDISIWNKLTAFNIGYFQNQEKYVGINLDNLRKVRNENVHRCSIIIRNEGQESKHLYKFLKKSTYNSIHSNLKNLSEKVKIHLN